MLAVVNTKSMGNTRGLRVGSLKGKGKGIEYMTQLPLSTLAIK